MIEIKENELYQEIELFVCGEKVGEAEIELKGKMLSSLVFSHHIKIEDMVRDCKDVKRKIWVQCAMGKCS